MDIKKKILLDILDFVNNHYEFNEKLKCLTMLGIFFKYNNLGCYSLGSLEKELIEKIITYYDIKQSPYDLMLSKKIAFIITEPYASGGHTRLMERLSGFLSEKPDLVITRSCSSSLKERMHNFFSSVEIFNLNDADSIESLLASARHFSQYSKLILNIHPEDITTVVAIGVAKKINPMLKVYFVNHADHVFSYGVSISDFWFEISVFGKKIDELRNLKCIRTFLGIPMIFSNTCYHVEKIVDGDNFLSSGSAFKFRPSKNISIIPIIDKVLKTYPHSKVTIIGVRPYFDYWWWSLKVRFPKRLTLRNRLPYDEYLKVTNNASVFIDSYPLPGGTAFAEQFLMGKKCIGLYGPIQGYSPVELFKRSTIEESMAKTDPHMINMVLKKTTEVHSFSEVKKRFVDAVEFGQCSSNKCEELIPWNGDEKFLEVDNIIRIPPQFLLSSPFTWKLIKLANMHVVVKFLFEKLMVTLKNFRREP